MQTLIFSEIIQPSKTLPLATGDGQSDKDSSQNQEQGFLAAFAQAAPLPLKPSDGFHLLDSAIAAEPIVHVDSMPSETAQHLPDRSINHSTSGSPAFLEGKDIEVSLPTNGQVTPYVIVRSTSANLDEVSHSALISISTGLQIPSSHPSKSDTTVPLDTPINRGMAQSNHTKLSVGTIATDIATPVHETTPQNVAHTLPLERGSSAPLPAIPVFDQAITPSDVDFTPVETSPKPATPQGAGSETGQSAPIRPVILSNPAPETAVGFVGRENIRLPEIQNPSPTKHIAAHDLRVEDAVADDRIQPIENKIKTAQVATPLDAVSVPAKHALTDQTAPRSFSAAAPLTPIAGALPEHVDPPSSSLPAPKITQGDLSQPPNTMRQVTERPVPDKSSNDATPQIVSVDPETKIKPEIAPASTSTSLNVSRSMQEETVLTTDKAQQIAKPVSILSQSIDPLKRFYPVDLIATPKTDSVAHIQPEAAKTGHIQLPGHNAPVNMVAPQSMPPLGQPTEISATTPTAIAQPDPALAVMTTVTSKDTALPPPTPPLPVLSIAGPHIAAANPGIVKPEVLTSDELFSSNPSAVQSLSASQATHQNPTLTRNDHPTARHVAHQVIEAARQLPNGPVEISLNPDELGRVRLSLSTHDGAITVLVAAERAETYDLLRRNMDSLGQDFRDLGYDDISFAFSDRDSDQNQDPDRENRNDGSIRHTQEPDLSRPAQASINLENGIDIRL